MNAIYARQPSLLSILIIIMILITSLIFPLGDVQGENAPESKTSENESSKNESPESKTSEDERSKSERSKSESPESKTSEDERSKSESPESKTSEDERSKSESPESKTSEDERSKSESPESKTSEDESSKSKSSESEKTENMRVKITEELPFLDVNHNGKTIRIERIQEKNYKLTNSYAKTSRSCPPFCIRPIQLSNGVKTAGELEVLAFLDDQVRQDTGILIDARLEDWNVKGTIPGSVNIPFTMFTGGLEDISTVNLLGLLGVKENDNDNDGWNFDETIELMLFCNGPWCGQSQKAIKYLRKLGYPASKIYWYRGGMQAWQSFGLTVIKP